jgi:hypothetical protein
MTYGLALWCFVALETISQLFRGSKFDWRIKPEYLEKITDLSQVTEAYFNKYSVCDHRGVI